MSSVGRRLDRLRGRLERLGGRCLTCVEWPPVRYEGWRPPQAESADVPERCPSCGWAPLTIVYTSEWRERSRWGP